MSPEFLYYVDHITTHKENHLKLVPVYEETDSYLKNIYTRLMERGGGDIPERGGFALFCLFKYKTRFTVSSWNDLTESNKTYWNAKALEHRHQVYFLSVVKSLFKNGVPPQPVKKLRTINQKKGVHAT